jgi:hypothetical protein
MVCTGNVQNCTCSLTLSQTFFKKYDSWQYKFLVDVDLLQLRKLIPVATGKLKTNIALETAIFIKNVNMFDFTNCKNLFV